jgi:hypothetical protein
MPNELTLKQIPLVRLSSQLLAGNERTSIVKAVSFMGAIQAQDFPMAKWAVGVRVPGTTDTLVNDALDDASIIRTHLLRPTWHLVTSQDVRWLLELSAPRIKTFLKSRHRQLELSERLFARSNRLLENALGGGKQMTREEIAVRFRQADIAVDQNRASHLLLRAELDAIICNGTLRKGKPTYALLDDRVPNARPFPRDEALAKLAQRYFNSRSPATLQDFSWWSGLSLGDARNAIEMVKTSLVSSRIGSRNYLFSNASAARLPEWGSLHLLPAYDEFILSYADRSASLSFVNEKKAISNNGIFRPVILASGQAIGVWNRHTTKDKIEIEAALFRRLDKATKMAIEVSLERLSSFLGLEATIKYTAA